MRSIKSKVEKLEKETALITREAMLVILMIDLDEGGTEGPWSVSYGSCDWRSCENESLEVFQERVKSDLEAVGKNIGFFVVLTPLKKEMLENC